MAKIHLTKQDRLVLGLKINTVMQYFSQQRKLVKNIMKFKNEVENSTLKDICSGVPNNVKTDRQGYPTKIEPNYLADDDKECLLHDFISFDDWSNNSSLDKKQNKFNKKFNISVVNSIYAVISNYLDEKYQLNMAGNNELSNYLSVDTILNNIDNIDIERNDILDAVESSL